MTRGSLWQCRNFRMYVALVACLVALGLISSAGWWPQRRAERGDVMAQTGAVSLPERSVKARFYFLGADGQGATLAVFDEKAVLIDAGSIFEGRRLLGLLRKMEIDALAAVIITDTSSQHLGGLIWLLPRIRVQAVVLPPGEDRSWAGRRLLRLMGEETVNVLKGKDLTKIDVGTDGVALEVITPDPESSPGTDFPFATDALALKVEVGNVNLLFYGNLTVEQLRGLVRVKEGLKADVVRVPSADGFCVYSPVFFEQIAPQQVVLDRPRFPCEGHEDRKKLLGRDGHLSLIELKRGEIALLKTDGSQIEVVR